MADRRLAKYGVEYILNFELYETDGIDFKTDATDEGADCSIRKDQGADTTSTNDFIDEGISYSLTITATEMQAKEVIVQIVDGTSTKTYLDKAIVIETYGNASALHAMDFDDAVRGGMTSLPNANADAAGGLAISDAGGLDMDAKLANTNEVTAARMGALTDWINGGRLDLLLDAIKAITDLLTLAAINAEVDTAFDTALPASPTPGSANDILDRQEELIVAGTAQTGTLSTTEMTTDLTISVNDQYNGRILTFRKDTTTAALRGQQTDITDTVTTNGKLTFTDLTTAPANGDTFEIT